MSQTPFQNKNNPPEWHPAHQRRQEYENWQPQHLISDMQPLQPNFNSPPPPYFSYGQSIPFPVPNQYGNFNQNILSYPQQNFPVQYQSQYVERPSNTRELQDKAWVSTWLNECGKGLQKKTPKPPLNIKKAHQALISSASCLNDMKKLQNEMHNSLDDQLSNWTDKVNKMNELKQHLSSMLTNFEDCAIILALKKYVAKQHGKRKRQQHKKLCAQKLNEINVAKRQALHMQIDAWRLQQQQLVERAKREKDTRREADAVLSEVRSKQSEGRRWQQVLENLNKLRQLRARAALDKGLEPTPQENERFSKVTSQLSELWQTQLKEYAAEEHALKVMLEEEAEVRGHHHKSSKQLIPLAEWERLLFGPVPDHNSDEFQYYSQADINLQSFVNIRREWDQFVASPGVILSSAPPIGWILPQPASSSDWASLLVEPVRD